MLNGRMCAGIGAGSHTKEKPPPRSPRPCSHPASLLATQGLSCAPLSAAPLGGRLRTLSQTGPFRRWMPVRRVCAGVCAESIGSGCFLGMPGGAPRPRSNPLCVSVSACVCACVSSSVSASVIKDKLAFKASSLLCNVLTVCAGVCAIYIYIYIYGTRLPLSQGVRRAMRRVYIYIYIYTRVLLSLKATVYVFQPFGRWS